MSNVFAVNRIVSSERSSLDEKLFYIAAVWQKGWVTLAQAKVLEQRVKAQHATE